MTLTHVVMFGFRDDVSEATRAEVGDKFHQLGKDSKRNGQPYIQSVIGGKNISIEGMANKNDVRWRRGTAGASRRPTTLWQQPALQRLDNAD